MVADQINAPDILSSVAFTFTTTDVDKQSLEGPSWLQQIHRAVCDFVTLVGGG